MKRVRAYVAETVDAAGEVCQYTDPFPSRATARSFIRYRRCPIMSQGCTIRTRPVWVVEKNVRRGKKS